MAAKKSKKNKRITTSKKQSVDKSISNHGESKPIIIAVIAIVAVLALSLLLFFSGRFVGKAISFVQLNQDKVGISLIDNSIKQGESASIPVKVNIGTKKSSVISFAMKYDQDRFDVNCDQIFDKLDEIFTKPQNLVVLKDSSCADGTVDFNYAALPSPGDDKYVTGNMDVAEITLTAKDDAVLGTSTLEFTSFDVYSLEDGKKIENLGILSPDVDVVQAVPQQQEACTANTKVCEGNNAWKQCNDAGTGYKDPVSCDTDEVCSGGNCVQSLNCVDVSSGLVSWWKGDDEKDHMGDNPVSLENGLLTTDEGKVGKAFSFDGTDDYLKIESLNLSKYPSHTFSAWIRPSGSTDGFVFNKGNTEVLEVQKSGGIYYQIYTGTDMNPYTLYKSGNMVSENQWHHLALTLDLASKSAKIYVDGVLVQSDNKGDLKQTGVLNEYIKTTGSSLHLGGNYQGKYFFKGIIDEPAFWNRALTAEEIKSIYDADTAGMCEFKPQICAKDQWVCLDPATRQQCNSDGTGYVGLEESCDSGKVCDNGACVEPLKSCTKNEDCSSGQVCDNNVCISSELKTPGVQGTKISLLELPQAGNMIQTKITALEDFDVELTAYTVLKNKDGKVLVLNTEKIPAMKKLETYLLSVVYSKLSDVEEKSVIIQDKLPDQGWTVHGQLVTKPKTS